MKLGVAPMGTKMKATVTQSVRGRRRGEITHMYTHTNTNAYITETHIASICKHTQQAGIVIDTQKVMV